MAVRYDECVSEDILHWIEANWSVITQAPWVFVGWTVLIAGAFWILLDYLKANQFSDLEGRLKLRDDEIADYKRKLGGATPDEAKARIDALEAQITKLQPRRLSLQQEATIVQALAETTGTLSVLQHVGPADSAKFADDIGRAFQKAGWQVQGSAVMMGGLTVGLQFTPHEISAAAQAAANALRAASLDFQSEGVHIPGIVGLTATILVGHSSDE